MNPIARITTLIVGLSAACASAAPAVPPVDVRAFGATGDGVTADTSAIQRAIDDCHAHGGGVVRFSAGRYLTGTIQLRDHVHLSLAHDATILGSTDAADYRNVDPFTDGDGHPMGYALIAAIDATDVGIEGPGTIDGQGKALAATQKPYAVRPFMTRFIRCHGVTLRDVTQRGPGAWANHFFQCDDVVARGLTIRSIDFKLPNNDGIDIDSCQRVLVEYCDIASGDDAICMKATSARACRDVTVRNCRLATHCNGIKMGTESLGDFTNVRASDCVMGPIGMSGIAVYGVDGAHIGGLVYERLTMDDVAVPISIRLGSRLRTFRAGDVAKPTGTLADVTIRDVRATNVRKIGVMVNGVPGHPVEGLRLERIELGLPGGGTAGDAQVVFEEKPAAYPEYNMFGKVYPASAIYLRHLRASSLTDVKVTLAKPDARPEVVEIDAEAMKTQPLGP